MIYVRNIYTISYWLYKSVGYEFIIIIFNNIKIKLEKKSLRQKFDGTYKMNNKEIIFPCVFIQIWVE